MRGFVIHDLMRKQKSLTKQKAPPTNDNKTKINLPHKTTMQLKLKLQPFPIIASHRLMNKTFLVRLSLSGAF